MTKPTTPALGEAITTIAALATDALASPDLSLLTDRGVLDLVSAADRAMSLIEAARAAAIREMVRREAAENEAKCTPAEFLHRGRGHTIRTCRAIVADALRRGSYAELTAAEASGTVTGGQGAAIARALDVVPDDVGAQVLTDCETTLVGLAASLDPGELLQAGWRVLEHVAPDRADELLGERLARDEERARRQRGLRLSDDRHGSMLIRGQLPIADGEELAAVLNAHAESMWKKQIDDEAVETAPRDQRLLLADALMVVVRNHQAHRQAPAHGGDRPRVAVHLQLTDLARGLGDLTLGSGAEISAAEARRLACDADLIPMVLDAHGVPLDVGRQHRLVTPHVRAALVARDRGCAFPGCDRGPAECEAHHIQPWWAGGPTSLGNLVLLCPRHHRKCEPGRSGRWDDDDPDRWHIRLARDDLPEITPPRGYDPARAPIRHTRFGLLRRRVAKDPPPPEFRAAS
ncbi:MAG: DUF222 domain-containing protein [Propionibacteriaceae bacterium]|nr:DUF222 domain-containing protein [Propionibacteriaceae bacterium]